MKKKEVDNIKKGDLIAMDHDLIYLVTGIDRGAAYQFSTFPLQEWQQKNGIYRWSSYQFLNKDWRILVKANAQPSI